jgi:hypothetical protein
VLCHTLCETPASPGTEKLVKLALRTILEEQVHGLLVLKVLVKSQDILMFEFLLDPYFSFHLVHQVSLYHLCLLHALQSIDVVRALPPHSSHHAEGTLAQRPARLTVKHFKLTELDLVPRR